MAIGDPKEPIKDPAEERVLKRLRILAGGVILSMIALLVVVDTLGRLYVDPEFHASELFLGTLIGALVLILGIEGLRGISKGNGS